MLLHLTEVHIPVRAVLVPPLEPLAPVTIIHLVIVVSVLLLPEVEVPIIEIVQQEHMKEVIPVVRVLILPGVPPVQIALIPLAIVHRGEAVIRQVAVVEVAVVEVPEADRLEVVVEDKNCSI